AGLHVTICVVFRRSVRCEIKCLEDCGFVTREISTPCSRFNHYDRRCRHAHWSCERRRVLAYILLSGVCSANPLQRSCDKRRISLAIVSLFVSVTALNKRLRRSASFRWAAGPMTEKTYRESG